MSSVIPKTIELITPINLNFQLMLLQKLEFSFGDNLINFSGIIHSILLISIRGNYFMTTSDKFFEFKLRICEIT